MQEYVTELSKYVLTTLMILYTLGSILCMSDKVKMDKKFYFAHCGIIFLMQFILFLNLTLVSHNLEYLIFYLFIQVLLLVIVGLLPQIYPKADTLLLRNMGFLLGIGLCMIVRFSFDKAIKQYIIALISLAIALFIPWLMSILRFWKKLKWCYCVVGISALSIVLILGEVTHGSKLSFTLKGITFQPSEFVKIIFIFFVAASLWNRHDFKRVLQTTIFAAVHVLVLVFSKDLGSALIFFVGYIFLVLAATGNYLYFLAGIFGGGCAAGIAFLCFEHVRVRVDAWLNPWMYIDTKGYAITQSLFAIATGSWFGMGPLQGSPDSIPFVEADFIFSAISEELGVIFGVCLIFVILCCFLEMIKVATKLQDRFYRLIVFGTAVMYLFQVFLTIGGGVNLIPLTGVTLPFISYGGSSVMVSVLMFFIVQGISVNYLNDKIANSEVKGFFKRILGKLKDNFHLGVSAGIFLLCFCAIVLHMTYFVATERENMVNHSYNPRQKMILSQNYRGTIYSSDQKILATTSFNENMQEFREYPYDNLFSHVVGFSVRGRTGIEALANYYLIHSNIPLSQKAKNAEEGVKNPGDNVYTTLNVSLQEAASKQLGTYNGAVVVTEVSTGKILAMVSKPDYDPNKLNEIWNSLTASSDGVLINRATQGLYPPGSTFKIITALEYLRQNYEIYNEYSFQCKGYYIKNGIRINCFHGLGHNQLDLIQSFAKSCNSSFANIGMELDRNHFQETLNQLLFNQSLPIALAHSKSKIAVSDDMTTDEMMHTAIGQGKTQITPIHLNLITCAIANKGVLMKPYIIDHIETADKMIVQAFLPEEYDTIMTVEEALILQNLMEEVVVNGTAKKLNGLDYRVAGKTGSAEFNKNGDSHAWFTGYAPADNPQIAITVIVEGAGNGSDYAVPVAKKLFEVYFNDLAKEQE